MSPQHVSPCTGALQIVVLWDRPHAQDMFFDKDRTPSPDERPSPIYHGIPGELSRFKLRATKPTSLISSVMVRNAIAATRSSSCMFTPRKDLHSRLHRPPKGLFVCRVLRRGIGGRPRNPQRYLYNAPRNSYRQFFLSDCPELGTALHLVLAGKALKNPETFKGSLDPLADALDAAVGVSKVAIVESSVASHYLVPDVQTLMYKLSRLAKQLHPVCISVAMQHLEGVKDSEPIVAINNVADVGLVADPYGAVPELVKKL
ncbi:hypothetical protein BS47DRAFT_1389237 [Hydnum rufescens UP504]|uniref:Uncharacterized protein n=1 Tax=Hydnum rufescens UP504 TaxID=1448309 RepID=A0A9P6DX17_9AGAM|nr:hypothetical protein BS47DRAFT_1389237 [Hydnum rufescens UP504]